jgi:hypothetical protein
MSLPPRVPTLSDNEFVHVRCLIANIHRPRNVSRPPRSSIDDGVQLEVVKELAASSESERSLSGSEKSDLVSTEEEPAPPQRAKSNSIAGSMLAPPEVHRQKRRRPSFLNLGSGGNPTGPLSAGPYLNVPKFTVTAPPGEPQHRRLSHGFAAFHGFALRRHSNTVCARMICKCERVVLFHRNELQVFTDQCINLLTA